MKENNFDILNNIITAKKLTNDILEQKILETEDSFEMFDCNCQKDNNKINKNNLNIEYNSKNNNDKENKILIKEENKNNINGLKNKNDLKDDKNQTNSNYNPDKGYNQIKNIIDKIKNGSIKINKEEKKINYLKINNKRKINKNNITNSIDYMNINKNKQNDELFSLSDNKYEKIKRKKKNQNIHNKSVDYNINKNIFTLNNNDSLILNNKFDIYQRLLEMKLEKLEKFKINSKNEIIKSNNILTTFPNRLYLSTEEKEIYSDDEILERKNKNNYNKNNKNFINNSNLDIYVNKNRILNEYLEDEISSFKSKKSRAQSKHSISSFISNNSGEKFIQTYERFKELQKKKNEKIEFLKKVKEDNVSKICPFNPKINQKSKIIKDNIFIREKKNLEQQKKKYEKIKIELNKKKEQEKIFENKNKISKKRKNPKICTKINDLFGGDNNNRNKKINTRQKSVDELTKKRYIHKPKIIDKKLNLSMINLQKSSNGENNKNISIINIKLEDKEKTFEKLNRKEKKKTVNNIYSPSFTPKLNRVKINYKIKDEEFYKVKNMKKEKIIDKNNIKSKNNNNNINNIKNNLNSNNSLYSFKNQNNQIKLTVNKLKKTRNNSSGYLIRSNVKNNNKKINYNNNFNYKNGTKNWKSKNIKK